jgi:hypothetical protein
MPPRLNFEISSCFVDAEPSQQNLQSSYRSHKSMITVRTGRQSLVKALPQIALPEDSFLNLQAGPSRYHRQFSSTAPHHSDTTTRQYKSNSRQNKKRLSSVLHAQTFAQALKELPHTKSTAPITLEPGESPYAAYSVRHSQSEQDKKAGPSLADLEIIRPPPPDVPRYTEEYIEAYKKVSVGLDNAFVKEQLRSLAEQLKVRGVTKKAKETLVRRIMQHGGWTEPEKDPALLRSKAEQGGFRVLF